MRLDNNRLLDLIEYASFNGWNVQISRALAFIDLSEYVSVAFFSLSSGELYIIKYDYEDSEVNSTELSVDEFKRLFVSQLVPESFLLRFQR
ncbi:TPA: hypothetical protein N2E47_002177 [Salmonella enterica]|nr:hypothetical protein [Salmonella enterica]